MKPKCHSQSGVSVTEVLIVLVVAAILFTASVAMFGRSTDNLQRQNAARGFKNFLERARFDSVKRRATTVDQMATVRIIDSDTFSYTIDLNQNGRIDDPSETIEVNVGTLGNIYITGANFVYPITIQFDQRGQIQAFNGAAAAVQPLVYFCNGTCTPSTANSQNSNIVYVSPTGTVAMMIGGSTIPTFDNPPVTNVPADLSVNPLLVEWEPSTSTPAPTATPTPEPSPTGSPTATPTATPWTDPSGSPTPTPTPVSTPASVCESGQNVSTGCTCVAPMWVRSNGKCR